MSWSLTCRAAPPRVKPTAARRARRWRSAGGWLPFKALGAAWSGAVMLGEKLEDDYRALAKAVGEGSDVAGVIAGLPGLARAVEVGKEGVSYDLVFPEVFWPEARFSKEGRAGFH